MARWTVKGLLQSTAKLTKWRERGYSSSKSRHVVKVIPYAGTNMFVMQQEHFGLTVNAHHIVNLCFYDVKITYKDHALDFHGCTVPNRNWYIETDLSKAICSTVQILFCLLIGTGKRGYIRA